ncbi:hypothetical protein QJS10_CPB22g01534 [Acorus calamus]|uniref:glutamate--tRNA ligase n=1 Tax=Acorus calamus TaxID=4465 RepID=A0AAV9C0S0_ACOCL|nr:hypothetical protein QJS10_CPB22g01534 [Acorus calamus]
MASLIGSPLLRIRVFPEVTLFKPTRLSFVRFRRGGSPVKAASAAPTFDGDVRVRFAPSPTGNLHVGGARTALFNYLFARSKGGKFVLRIEDTDLERSTKQSEEALLHDLSWLGLDWDEGPGVGGEYGPYRQSERNSMYKEYAEKLLNSGFAYRCFCSNEELEQMKEIANLKKLPPVYTGKWATATEEEAQDELAKGTPYTYRFRVPKEGTVKINDLIRGEVSWSLDTLGDFVILRSNGQPVYNFCVTVDDATMRISHVIRAEEHLPNTLRQALIYKALGFSMPQFAHVSLILAPDRSKLSKRHGATSVGQFKEMGYLPQAMVNYLALLGWGDGTENEFFTMEQLVEKFSIERVNKSGAVFDSAKLRWMNGQHLKAIPQDQLTKVLGEHWKSNGILSESEGMFVKEVVDLLKDGIELIPDSDAALLNLLSYPLHNTLASAEGRPLVGDKLSEVAASLLSAYDSGEFHKALEEGHTGQVSFHASSSAADRKAPWPRHGVAMHVLREAGLCGIITPQAGFVTLDERFKIMREVDWEALNRDSKAESVAVASSH